MALFHLRIFWYNIKINRRFLNDPAYDRHLKGNAMNDKDIKLIPPEDEPYEWARKEMDKYFTFPDRKRIVHLDEMTYKPLVHMSLFRKGKDDPVILRVYWADIESFKYSIVVNYDELVSKYPGEVEMLLENGRDAYRSTYERFPDYVRNILYGDSGVLS